MRSLAAILVGCTLGLTLVAESHAAPPKHGIGVGVLKQNYRGGHAAKAPKANTPPDKPCRFDNRLDIEIVNGVWFECSCEALMIGTVCDWYEITSPAHDPHSAPKKHKAKKQHRVVRIYPLPAVTR